ncbi:hypothetical protein AYL99_11994 [Fonsecaea erecta]|uniref:Uncharacterized protein n=1 Tax=Fonsecaea erecta TaxID=1367422 RepID=A0A178Z1Y4_9EURO|nr:hypothetical protein AYL99_11994 [Fonsecaea erecta]OAP53808.1 hypothetical protein AYL99_11994 [Fonsecaea erecta]
MRGILLRTFTSHTDIQLGRLNGTNVSVIEMAPADVRTDLNAAVWLTRFDRVFGSKRSLPTSLSHSIGGSDGRSSRAHRRSSSRCKVNGNLVPKFGGNLLKREPIGFW